MKVSSADLLIGEIGAGKSIYCEKLIDLDINRVKAMVQQAQKTDLPMRSEIIR